MKRSVLVIEKLFLLTISVVLIAVIGCKNSPTDPNASDPTTNQAALLKITESDSAVVSFMPNFNEEAAMTILGETDANVYPIREGQKLRLVSRNFTYTAAGDTAFGTYTQTFEGVLYVQSNSNGKDTVIQKPFTSVITRHLIFIRVGHDTANPMFNWKLVAVSLPAGGTVITNVKIASLVVYLANGDTLQVNDPGTYFLSRMFGKMHGEGDDRDDVPFFHSGQPVTIKVTVNSAYADTDFVTITHDADMDGFHREKQKFNLISSTPSGSGFVKVYQRTFVTGGWRGYFHAVINAFSNASISNNTSPVEESTWGVPYLIK